MTRPDTSSSADLAVSMRDLHVAWDDTLILHGISIDIPVGQTVAITGANGSGKSTFVHAILGNAPVTRGSMSLFGVRVSAHGKRPWARIGYVPQYSRSGGGVASNAHEVVASGLLGPRKFWLTRSDRHKAMEALDLVGLAHRAHDPVSILSGGQRQRVNIARALVRRPDFLIMDEPLTGIDAVSRQRLASIVQSAKDAGTTIVLVLHELGELRPLLDRQITIASGHITYDGAPLPPSAEEVTHHG